MLIIRFQRVGRTNDPAFRVVVTEKQNAPQGGKALEVLGSYHPKTKHTILKSDRIQYWIGQGAQVSDTAHNLLVKNNLIKSKTRPVVKPSKAKAEAAEIAA